MHAEVIPSFSLFQIYAGKGVEYISGVELLTTNKKGKVICDFDKCAKFL